MEINFDDLEASIRYRFYRCNEMSKKQAEDYAAIAVNEFKRQFGLVEFTPRQLTNPQTPQLLEQL